MRNTGKYEKLGDIEYFTPFALPPTAPPLQISMAMTQLYGEAMIALGQLNEMSHRLPNVSRFIKAYVMKEALMSSDIEGIHTTLIEVYTTTLPGKKASKDTQLVSNYTKALHAALELIEQKGLPITSRVILSAHKSLMDCGEGEKSSPGTYRKQFVRVGNFTPPIATAIPDLMADLEKFINVDPSTLPLIKAGLAHVQFETIHPFLDGNGRIGRLLIVLTLIESSLLSVPIIYPSYFFKKNQSEYYQALDRVRTHGDFENWISFFLTAIRDSSIDAHKRVENIEALDSSLRNSIKSLSSRGNYMKALDFFYKSPVFTTTMLARELGITFNSAKRTIAHFLDSGVLAEDSKIKRNKTYCFESYLNILEKHYD